MAAFVVYMLITLLVLNRGGRRVQLAWFLPWLVLDCLGSVLIGERFSATLSAKAWDARNHTRWYWTHRFIDGLFGPGHCHVQWLRELHYGSVWTSWAAEWRGEVIPAGSFTDDELEA